MDVAELSADAQLRHEDAVQKHTRAVQLCEEKEAPNLLLSNPKASLLQFPGDGVLPGHRATVVASCPRVRLVLAAVVTPAGTDFGSLEPLFTETRRVLLSCGMPPGTLLEGSGDSGFWSATDLSFLEQSASWLSMCLKEMPPRGPHAGKPQLLGREAFRLERATQSVVCPAGRPMQGPLWVKALESHRYRGVGCSACPLKARCTTGTSPRSFHVKWDYERQAAAMRSRLRTAEGRARYAKRMATIEPVFAALQRDMGFRRLSSRHPTTVDAEVRLKLLAYNLRRLLLTSRHLGAPHLRRGRARLLN